MKSLARNIAIYLISLYLLPNLIAGIKIEGGFATYFFGSVALTLMLFLVKPILNLISFPLNLITFGLFSIVTNMIILYLLTIFVPNIIISSFTFHGAKIAGFVIPQMQISQFFAFALTAVVLSTIVSCISWLID